MQTGRDGELPELAAQIEHAATAVRARGVEAPKLGIVLGSGLGAWAQRLERRTPIPYGELPHMPLPGVAGHAGTLWLGYAGTTAVACLEGRVHAYEGYPLSSVVFGVRLLAALGVKSVLLTNAAGGIRRDLRPGSFMLITDHINLTGNNPLVGWAGGAGSPFIDMTVAYDLRLRRAAEQAAAAVGVELQQGVYAGLLGPSYETPAEIRMLRSLGADAVGMSTVSEVVALRGCGVAVGAISCITNAAAGLGSGELSHDDVQLTAARSRASFESLLSAWAERAEQPEREDDDGPPTQRTS